MVQNLTGRDEYPFRLRAIVCTSGRIWVAALKRLLNSSETITVVQGCRDFLRLPTLVRQHSPDLVAVALPVEGLETAQQLVDLRIMQPELAFLIFLPQDTDQATFRQLAGTPGVAVLSASMRPVYLEPIAHLIAAGFAVTAVQRGPNLLYRRPLPPLRSDRLMGTLTMRERVALEGLAKGMTEHEVAAELRLSLRATQACVARARQKLGAGTRTHAVALALQAGLLDGPVSIGVESTNGTTTVTD